MDRRLGEPLIRRRGSCCSHRSLSALRDQSAVSPLPLACAGAKGTLSDAAAKPLGGARPVCPRSDSLPPLRQEWVGWTGGSLMFNPLMSCSPSSGASCNGRRRSPGRFLILTAARVCSEVRSRDERRRCGCLMAYPSGTRAGSSGSRSSIVHRSPGDAMSHLNCPHCGLTVRLRASFLALEHCPRCLARRGIAVEMLASGRRIWPPLTDRANKGIS